MYELINKKSGVYELANLNTGDVHFKSESDVLSMLNNDIKINGAKILNSKLVTNTLYSRVVKEFMRGGIRVPYSNVDLSLNYSDSTVNCFISPSARSIALYIPSFVNCISFRGNNKIERIKLTGGVGLKTCYCMFFGCSNLKYVDLSKLNTFNVRIMHRMFCSCRSLNKLDLSLLDTSNCLDMHEMFADCMTLQDLNVSNFKTDKVATMSCMFDGCHSLTNIDLSSFRFDSVVDTSNMFCDCRNLEYLDLSNFNAPSLESMSYMFSNCLKLKSINKNTIRTKFGCKTLNVFQHCICFNENELESLLFNFQCPSYESIGGSDFMFIVIDKIGDKYVVLDKSTMLDEIVTKSELVRAIKLGVKISGGIKGSDGNVCISTLKSTIMSKIQSSSSSSYRINSYIFTVDDDKIKMMFDGNIPDKVYIPSFVYCANLSEKSLERLKLTGGRGLVYCNDMFSDTEIKGTLDLSDFHTDNVINMYAMFAGFSARKINFKNFKTNNVKTMESMFENCSVDELDLRSFDLGNLENRNYMFKDCNANILGRGKFSV